MGYLIKIPEYFFNLDINIIQAKQKYLEIIKYNILQHWESENNKALDFVWKHSYHREFCKGVYLFLTVSYLYFLTEYGNK